MLVMHRRVFNLGTQGPDILFYYYARPCTKNRDVRKLGGRMHAECVGAFFKSALDYIKAREGCEREVLFTYLCGYACHYSLDLNAHPYIYYRSGFVRKGEPPTLKYSTNHRVFETSLDVLMLDRLCHMKPYELNAPELIRVADIDARPIAEMLSAALENVYHERLGVSELLAGINNMASVQALLRSRSGLKKTVARTVEKGLVHYPLVSGMIYPPELKNGPDFLNLAHRPWALPWDLSKQSTASFPELFDRAARESGILMDAILRSPSGPKDLRHALDLIGNRSFSSGLDLCIEAEFQYYDSIFEE